MKQSILDMFLKAKPGIYPLKDNYDVLKDISLDNKIYRKGAVISLSEKQAEPALKNNFVKLKNDRFKLNSISDILDYIDKRSPEMPDVEFSPDFTRIKIYPINYVPERSEDSV